MSPRGRPPATIRVHRLLAMLPWLLSRGGATIAEITARFGASEADVLRDLHLGSRCGLPPYTPDELFGFWVDEEDGVVHVQPGASLTRPPRLSVAEGFTVLASGQALLAVPGADVDGALGRALDKLGAVLGDPSQLAVDLAAPEHLEAVRDAAERGDRLRVTYYSAWRDEVTDRELEPHVVYNHAGRWYVDALDVANREVRRFRVDRLRAIERTGVRFDPPHSPAPETVFEPPADAVTVVLDLPASARWVVEAYPATWTEGGDRLRVELTVVGTAWLERLLLRVGAGARVVSPDELRDVGRDAARRLLAAYDD